MAVRGGLSPLSGLIWKTGNSVCQEYFTFVRKNSKKSENVRRFWLWQPWLMVSPFTFITKHLGFYINLSDVSFKDFATPSLTDDNTVFYTEDNAELERREIEQFQLRRSWETRWANWRCFQKNMYPLNVLFRFTSNGKGLNDIIWSIYWNKKPHASFLYRNYFAQLFLLIS